MARPRQENADYFSHDADMRNDVKIKALRRKYKHEGYSVWNMLLEYLTDCNYFQFEDSEINIELIAADFDVDVKLLNEILKYLIKLDLIQKNDNKITCIKLVERFSGLIGKRDKSRDNYNNREFQTQKLHKKEVSDAEMPQSKVKESKGKESIINIDVFSKKIKIPTKQQVIDYFSENGYIVEAAEIFYAYAEGMEWKDKEGREMKWKATAVSWFKKEHKKPFVLPSGEKLGQGEEIIDGRRMFFGQEIPMEAPPRPSSLYTWAPESKKWYIQ